MRPIACEKIYVKVGLSFFRHLKNDPFLKDFSTLGQKFEFLGTGIMVSDVKFPVLSNGNGFRTIRANAEEKNL